MRDILGHRLARLGWHMTGEMLARAEALVRLRDVSPETASDIQLMTICVDAYRRPEYEPGSPM